MQASAVNALLQGLTADASAMLGCAPGARTAGHQGRSPLGDPLPLPPLPATPLGQSDLLVNAEGQPNIGSELRAELATADSRRPDLRFRDLVGRTPPPRGTCGRGRARRRVRVITTTYMGATEKRAVDELVRLGATCGSRSTLGRPNSTRRRGCSSGSGLSTAFVGSSNLSHTALFDGLEWNVRLSSMDAAHVIDRVRMTFESHWASEHFEDYDPAVNGEELAEALKRARAPLARRGVDDLLRQPRRPPVPAPAADARGADGRARAPRTPPQSRGRGDRDGQDGRGRARLPAARRPANARCSSSRIARRSCGSRWPPIAQSCETGRSGRSTAAAGSPLAGTYSRWSSRCISTGSGDRIERLRRRGGGRVPSRRRRDLRPAPQSPPADGASRTHRDARAP